jgi:hypothetical protein
MGIEPTTFGILAQYSVQWVTFVVLASNFKLMKNMKDFNLLMLTAL